MIQVKNLTIIHRKDLRTILKDFSLVLDRGDKVALIGEEGNGKSTLLKLLYDPSLTEDYVEYTGEIRTGGARIGYLAQELTKEQKEKSVYSFFAESELFFSLTPKELGRIAGKLGFSRELFYAEQTIGSLSGGEKVKLQLAAILMEEPDALFLDEPSNDIDLGMLEWLEQFIRDSDVPVLFISHDETLLERTANKIVHLEQVKRKTECRHTIAAMDYRTYVKKRSEGLRRQEQNARKERSEYEKQQERFRQIQQKVEHRQNAVSRQDPHGGRLLKKKMHAVKSMERRFQKEAEGFTELPDTEDAMYIRLNGNTAVPNGKRILDFYRRELRAGERVLAREIRLAAEGPAHICITGRNGVGKTTLLREIAAELLARTDIRAFYMPQNYEELLKPGDTPVGFLAESGSREEVSRIRTYLGSMKYTADEMGHPASELSGGQKAKLLLLKISLLGPDVLILDEPTRNFSPLSGPVIRRMFADYRGAIISISHDRKYIREVTTAVYVLTKNGLERTGFDNFMK